MKAIACRRFHFLNEGRIKTLRSNFRWACQDASQRESRKFIWTQM